MARDDVQEYINQLRAIANYETADLKARLTEKLLHIIDETSTAKYTCLLYTSDAADER